MLFPEPAWVCAYSMSMAYGEGRGFKPQPETKGRAMNNLITIALAISMKKAPTIGTMFSNTVSVLRDVDHCGRSCELVRVRSCLFRPHS